MYIIKYHQSLSIAVQPALNPEEGSPTVSFNNWIWQGAICYYLRQNTARETHNGVSSRNIEPPQPNSRGKLCQKKNLT
jgi:hypothetical protein